MKTVKTLLAALAVVLAIPAVSQASNYPPDYGTCGPITDSVTVKDPLTGLNGPFELIRWTNKVPGRGASLTVSYRGYLRSKYPDNQIKIYVRLNGNDPYPVLGTAMLQATTGSNNDAYIYLHSGPRNCAWCDSSRASGWPECQAYLDAGNAYGWVCQWPSALENHMFQWAYDPAGYLNAWDVYVAAEANGEWDSNFGNNFYGRLPERKVCAY